MALIVNTAESQVSGTTATLANTGGGGDTALNNITPGTGGSVVFSNEQARFGTNSYKLTRGTASCYIVAGDGTSSPAFYTKVWLRLPTYPTATMQWVTALSTSGSVVCRLHLTSTGAVQLINSAGAVVTTPAGTVPLNAWVKVVLRGAVSATAGLMALDVYDTNGNVLITASSTTANTGTVNFLRTVVGNFNNVAFPTLYVDQWRQDSQTSTDPGDSDFGVTTTQGIAAGSTSWVGSTAGQAILAGAAAGAIAFAGLASGSTAPSGSAAGSTAYAGAATGQSAPSGTASGATAWVGAAAGSQAPSGVGSGSLAYVGAAAGTAPTVGAASGSASGTTSWSGAATGSRASTGAASGATSWTGLSAGAVVTSGTTSGGVAWVGVAAGTTPPVPVTSGSSVGGTSWRGLAFGTSPRSGNAAGSLTYNGSAAGELSAAGAGGGLTSWEGTASGVTPRPAPNLPHSGLVLTLPVTGLPLHPVDTGLTLTLPTTDLRLD